MATQYTYDPQLASVKWAIVQHDSHSSFSRDAESSVRSAYARRIKYVIDGLTPRASLRKAYAARLNEETGIARVRL